MIDVVVIGHMRLVNGIYRVRLLGVFQSILVRFRPCQEVHLNHRVAFVLHHVRTRWKGPIGSKSHLLE